MNHIILDLEFNEHTNNKHENMDWAKVCPFEIIEIGAVKLNDKFEEVDTFRILIKPQIYSFVNRYVYKKTKISIEDLQYGFEFSKAINLFLKWIGEDYTIYTWSENDYPIMKNNCILYNEDYEWFDNYIDLQIEYKIYTNSKDIRGLKKAINDLRIPEVKLFHSALSDAQYTAEILKAMKHGKKVKAHKTISDEGIIKYVEKSKSKVVRCPYCGRFLKRQYEKKSYRNKYNILAECDECKCKVRHMISPSKSEMVKVRTTIIDNNGYSSMKTQIIASQNKK